MGNLMGSTTPSTLSSASKLTDEQTELLRKLTGIISGQVGEGAESYPGDLTAGPSPLQQQSWDAISGLISGGTQPGASKQAIDKILAGSIVPGPASVSQYTPQPFDPDATTGLFSQAMAGAPTFDPSATTDLFSQAMGTSADTFRPDMVKEWYQTGEFDPTAIQDWYQNALVTPAMAEWEKKIAPTIQEKFIGQNAGSSGAANRAISGSASDLMTNLNAQLADKLASEKGAYDTRKFSSGMAAADALLGEKGAADTRQFASGTGLANALLGGQQTAGAQQYSTASSLANALLGGQQVAGGQQFTAGMAGTGAENQAITDYINNLFSAGQADLTRATAVPGMENQSMQGLFQALGMGTTAGATQQGMDQNALIEAFTKWQQEQPSSNPWLQFLKPAMQTSATEPVVLGGSTREGALGPLANILSAVIGNW